MRNVPNFRANRCRIRDGELGSSDDYGNNGAFAISTFGSTTMIELNVVVSDAGGWDHVSVSKSYRCPTWEEMCFIKGIFFRDDEWVMQLHPPKDKNISHHNYCLHMWRPQTQEERETLRTMYLVSYPEWIYGDNFPTAEHGIPIPAPIMVGAPPEDE
jgi:hypothetical protein